MANLCGSGLKFLHFHTVFGKIGQILRDWCNPLGNHGSTTDEFQPTLESSTSFSASEFTEGMNWNESPSGYRIFENIKKKQTFINLKKKQINLSVPSILAQSAVINVNLH